MIYTGLYFSATGNSKFFGEGLLNRLGGECFSIEDKTVDFSDKIKSSDVVLFFYPIIVGGVAKTMRKFAVRFTEELKGKKVAIICTEALTSGDGAAALTRLFEKDWFEVIYAEHIIMPSNVCNLPGMTWAFSDWVIADEKRKVLKKIEKIANDIENGRVKKRGFSQAAHLFGIVQSGSQERIEERAAVSIAVNDDCIACGLCAKVCPAENFIIEGKAIPQGKCEYCYRCINKCPKKAITSLFKSKVKKQYHGMK